LSVLPKHVACIDRTNKVCCGWRQHVCQFSSLLSCGWVAACFNHSAH